MTRTKPAMSTEPREEAGSADTENHVTPAAREKRSITLRGLIRRLEERGDATAIMSFDRDERYEMSSQELARKARRLADGLRERGLGRGDHVAILGTSRPEWIVSALAIMAAGGSASPMDTRLRPDTLRSVLNDSGAAWLFTTRDLAPAIRDLALEREIRLIVMDAGREDAEADKDERGETERDAVTRWSDAMGDEASGERAEIDVQDEAALFYTSGTTGPPKGVPLKHAHLDAQLRAVEAAGIIGEDDRVMLPLPLHHVYPFVIGMLAPLAMGSAVILPRALTGPQIQRALVEGEATALIGVPRLYRALLAALKGRAARSGWMARAGLAAALGTSRSLRRMGLRSGSALMKPVRGRMAPALRIAASGGGKLDPDTELTLEAIGWRVAVGYGLTETAPLVTLKTPQAKRLGSVGRAVEGVEIRIDREFQSESEDGEEVGPRHAMAGEVVVRGDCVFDGYRHLPEKTDEAFTADGWFRTGDLGWFDDDGLLRLEGRTSTLIVTEGGKNVQPQEVEEAYEQAEGVREVGVLEGDEGLAAVVVPKAKAGESDRDDVGKAVEARSREIAEHHRLSDFVVSAEPIPRTQLGKIQRHKLKELYERLKSGAADEADAGPMSPAEMSADDRGLVESGPSAAVWQWLSERYANRKVTPDANLQLDLGVDSMEWLNITLEIRARAGVEIDEGAIERIETVRDLLQEVMEGETRAGGDDELFDRPEEALSEDQRRWLQPMGRGRRALSNAGWAIGRGVMRGVFGVRSEGAREAFEQTERGPVVIAPNHASYLDPFAVAAALPKEQLARTWWAGWTGVAFGNPIVRSFSRLGRVVPIDPAGGARSSLAYGAAVLKRGETLVWFPEGQRSRSGALGEFRPGLGLLLDHVDATVVPVVIEGAAEILPVGSAWPRFSRRGVTVRFLKPVRPDELASGEASEDREGRAGRIMAGLRSRMA